MTIRATGADYPASEPGIRTSEPRATRAYTIRTRHAEPAGTSPRTRPAQRAPRAGARRHVRSPTVAVHLTDIRYTSVMCFLNRR
jgi:hypothetical protein